MARTLNNKKNKKDISEQKSLEEMIAKLAYQRFLNRGCIHGYDQEDWFEAKKEVVKQLASKNKRTSTKTKNIQLERS